MNHRWSRGLCWLIASSRASQTTPTPFRPRSSIRCELRKDGPCTRHNGVLQMDIEAQTRAHRNQIRSKWARPQPRTMHSWAAGPRLQLQQLSPLTNRRHKAGQCNLPNRLRREPWTQRIRTGREHAGHRLGEGQCLQAPFPSIPTRITHLPRSLHTRASRRIHFPCLGSRTRSQLPPPPLYSKLLLLWTKRQRQPGPPNHLPMSSIWVRRQLCYPPKHLLSLNPYQRNLGHKALSHNCRARFPSHKARRAPYHTPPNQPLRSNQGRTSA
jgi:hypothetical protein